MAIDLGTGDGRYVLERAAASRRSLVIGLDADSAAMAESSRRAIRRRLANAIFLADDVARLPAALAGLSELVTIHFPWRSLLRAAAGAEVAVSRLVKPAGVVRILLAASQRDAGGGLTAFDSGSVEGAWASAGFQIEASRPAGLADAVDVHSSWGKRLLRAGDPRRGAWLLEARRGTAAASVKLVDNRTGPEEVA